MKQQNLSSTQKAQMATRVAELNEQIHQQSVLLQTVEQKITTAKKRKQRTLENEATQVRQERAKLLQEANTLRAELDMPMVVPDTFTQPQVTQVVVQEKRGGGCLRNTLVATGVLVVIILGIALIGSSENAEMSTSSGETAQEQNLVDTDQVSDIEDETTQTTSVEQAFGIGQDVQVDEVRWKIIEATDEGQTLESDNQFIETKTTGGKFVRVEFEMENLSKDMLSFAGIDLVDNQDREYKPYSEGYAFTQDGKTCIIENLNPNVPKACEMIFELPTDATELSAKVGDLKLFGSQEALIDLGF